MEINLIIRELLAKHSFISLPGIGSFVQSYEPAKLSSDGKTFIPPKQAISFDTTRNFNDEAIENFICNELGVDHRKANELLTEFLNKCLDELGSGREVSFKNVGSISKSKDGIICFKADPESELVSSTYGLNELETAKLVSGKPQPIKEEIKLQPKQAEPKKPEPKPEPIVYHEKKSNASKIFVGVAVLLVVVALTTTFILIPDFRFWSKTNEQATSKVDSSDLASKTTLQKEAPTTIDSSKVETDTTNLQVDQTIKVKTEKKAALYYEEPKPQETKTFYLIVGSFGKIENAQKLSEKYSKRGFSPEIIEGNNMYRVSIAKSRDKNQAIGDFNKFRAENPNEQVWVLGI